MKRRLDKLSTGDEMAYHRREWLIQRIGWVLMALFLGGAAAGLFGSGPLSHASSGDTARGTIRYERFARHGAETQLQVCAPRTQEAAKQLRVAISREYLETFEIRSVVPEASAMEGSPHHVDFLFDATTQRSCVVFRLVPTRIGRVRGPFTLDSNHELVVSQFVYP